MKNVIRIGLLLLAIGILSACNGHNGQAGNVGLNGGDCSVVSVPASSSYPNGGALITCPNSSTFVSNGQQGAVGPSCTVTTLPSDPIVDPNGGSLISCPDGTSSIVQNGSQGDQGVSGTPGTIISTIQFCPGFTPTYNGSSQVFPEYGVCIAGQLYGVYSANSGFWALLPPGNYSSNGINASCDFTIGADCTVN